MDGVTIPPGRHIRDHGVPIMATCPEGVHHDSGGAARRNRCRLLQLVRPVRTLAAQSERRELRELSGTSVSTRSPSFVGLTPKPLTCPRASMCRERGGRSPRRARRFSAGPAYGTRSGAAASSAAHTVCVPLRVARTNACANAQTLARKEPPCSGLSTARLWRTRSVRRRQRRRRRRYERSPHAKWC